MAKQITIREKVFLSVGALVTIGIFVYFVFWPLLRGGQSRAALSLEEIQERLESVEKIGDMEPLLVSLEERMREQSGYREVSFKRGTEDSEMIRRLDQAAVQAGIKNLEQLDAKPDTSRRTRVAANSGEAAPGYVWLAEVADGLYLHNVMDEVDRLDEMETEASDPLEAESPGEDASENPGNSALSEANSAPLVLGSSKEENPRFQSTIDNQESKISSVFPPLPGNIPVEVKRSLARSMEEHQGRTTVIADEEARQVKRIVSPDIDRILDEAGVEDGEERRRIKKRLELHIYSVSESKKEILQWLGKLGILRDDRASQKTDRFSVKMVFKSQMDQLVKLLYGLQNSAKWLRIEGIRISVSDRKQSLLAVELSMTATILYD